MSVVEVDMENVLTTLVDTFRKPCFKHIKSNYEEAVEEGIAIRFNMSYSAYNDEHICHRSADCVVIFTGNTSVYVGRDMEDSFLYQKFPEVFKNTSNHDSCWRSDGLNFLSDVYFGMCSSMNAERRSHGLEELAPIEFTCNTRFNFSESIERVRIRRTKFSDTDPYHYRLLEIKRLPLFE